MKKLIFLLLFSLTILLPAPGIKELYVEQPEAIYKWDPMLYAFKLQESRYYLDTVNSLGYSGVLQLGQQMIDEANRICEMTGDTNRFTMKDAFSDERSTQIWYIVQDYWNPTYNLRTACHVWNPLANDKYYKEIRKRMKSMERL